MREQLRLREEMEALRAQATTRRLGIFYDFFGVWEKGMNARWFWFMVVQNVCFF